MSSWPKRNLLLLSNSTLHPTGPCPRLNRLLIRLQSHDQSIVVLFRYLEYAKDILTDFLTSAQVGEVLFVPYALRDQDGYAAKARERFTEWGFKLNSVHETQNPVEAVKTAQAIFIGGGNTFQLLKNLYDNKLVEAIRSRVLEEGIPYIGSSAGTNVATVTINTTNDMPIVFPPSFNALGLVPFNINPHYIDTDPTSTHKGETREERIVQYQEVPGANPVLALREGSILRVIGDTASLMGTFNARLFVPGKPPAEYPPQQDFTFLLANK